MPQLQRILLIDYPIYRQAARREKVLTIPEGENRIPGCFLSGITLPPGSRQCPSPPCPETSARSVNQDTRSCDHRTQTLCFSLFCLFPFFGRQIRAVQSSFGTYRLTRYFCGVGGGSDGAGGGVGNTECGPSTSPSLYCTVTVNLTINTTVGSDSPAALTFGAAAPARPDPRRPPFGRYTIYSSSSLTPPPSSRKAARVQETSIVWCASPSSLGKGHGRPAAVSCPSPNRFYLPLPSSRATPSTTSCSTSRRFPTPPKRTASAASIWRGGF